MSCDGLFDTMLTLLFSVIVGAVVVFVLMIAVSALSGVVQGIKEARRSRHDAGDGPTYGGY